MDLRQLRYFIALAEHRSFVRAADAMGITQPAFSRSIQGLEQELGCQLVDRGSKDLRPTPEGQVVLQHALSLVQGSANLIHEIAQLNKLDAGEPALRQRAGAGPATGAGRGGRLHQPPPAGADQPGRGQLGKAQPRPAPRRDRILRRRHPRLRGRPELPDAPADPRRGQFFCRPQHPLLGKDSLSTNDLFNYPLASTLIPPGIRKLLANLSGKIDFAANIRCENMHALIRIVRQTDAIGIASDETLRPYLQRGELQPLQWRNLPQNLDSLSARCGIISRSGYRLSAAAKAMIETLVELDQAQHAAA